MSEVPEPLRSPDRGETPEGKILGSQKLQCPRIEKVDRSGKKARKGIVPFLAFFITSCRATEEMAETAGERCPP